MCFLIGGFAFYPLYKQHINRKIKKIDLETINEDMRHEKRIYYALKKG